MLLDLMKVPAGDIVLLHACCHNPTGADLNQEQWRQVIKLAEVNGFLLMFDFAYQGFGESLDEDAFAIRLAAETLPEIIVSYSCSKNFGIYRERVGCTLFINKNSKQSEATFTHAIASMRSNYSMSPYHGAGIVGGVLSDPVLNKLWKEELADICLHLKQARGQFADMMNNKQHHKDFNFITNNKGMFSFLGIDIDHVLQLRKEFGIYLLDSSRINFGSLSIQDLEYTTDSIAAVINKAKKR
jgi:aspartate aminotransferase